MTAASLSPRASICQEIENLLPCRLLVSWKTEKGKRAIETEIEDPEKIRGIFENCVNELEKINQDIRTEAPFMALVEVYNITNPKKNFFRLYNPNPIAGIPEVDSSGDDEVDVRAENHLECSYRSLRSSSSDSSSADS